MNLRNLFQSVVNAILPWPEAELPLIRHTPLADDSDVSFWSDARYLYDLQNEILDTLLDNDLLLPELPFPVCSDWYEDFSNAWPDDIAATQLAAWRYELDMDDAA